MKRLSQADLVEAVGLLLQERGEVPSDVVGALHFRFGMVGDPQITLVGDAVDLPHAGDIYMDWRWEETPNVALLPQKGRRRD